jgi:hypothetical protein
VELDILRHLACDRYRRRNHRQAMTTSSKLKDNGPLNEAIAI